MPDSGSSSSRSSGACLLGQSDLYDLQILRDPNTDGHWNLSCRKGGTLCHFEPSLDAFRLRSDVISSIKILTPRHSRYRGTSPIRKRPPPYDPPMTLGIGLR